MDEINSVGAAYYQDAVNGGTDRGYRPHKLPDGTVEYVKIDKCVCEKPRVPAGRLMVCGACGGAVIDTPAPRGATDE